MIVQPRKGAPANVHGAKSVAFRPLHNVTQFIPVVDLFKIQLFHRRSCYEDTVKVLILYPVKGGIKVLQMLPCGVFWQMCLGIDEGDINLQWGIAEQSKKRGSVSNLVGIRFTMPIFSGLMSWPEARSLCITNIFSLSRVLKAGRPFGILIGILSFPFLLFFCFYFIIIAHFW